MLSWWIAAAVYVIAVVIACVRVIWKGVRIERNLAQILEVERETKRRGRPVHVVGAPGTLVAIGRGTHLTTIAQVVTTGFELRHADGSLYTIADGVDLTVVTRDVVVDEEGRVFVRANAELMYLPDEERTEDGPLRRAGALAAVSGDSLLLFDRDTSILATPLRVRRLAWPRVVVVFGVLAGVLTMSALYAPASAWNAPMFLLLVLLLLEQTVIKGSLTMYLSSRAP